MKTKFLLVIVFLMGTVSVFAQDTLRQGNLTYVEDSRGFVRSVESTKLVIEDNYHVVRKSQYHANLTWKVTKKARERRTSRR